MANIIVIMDHTWQTIHVCPFPQKYEDEIEEFLADETLNGIKSFDSNIDYFVSENFNLNIVSHDTCHNCKETIEVQNLLNYCDKCLTHQ